MKRLLMLSILLTSCGGEALLVLPEIDFNYKSNRSRKKEATSSNVHGCNIQAVNNRCTPRFVHGRALQPHEVYDRYCWERYNECLRR